MSRAIVLPVLLALAGLGLDVHAAPTPITGDMFEVGYSVVDPETSGSRGLSAIDRELFVNQARCECGQPLRAEIQLRPSIDAQDLDIAKILTALVGTFCDVAEQNPVGQFRQCGALRSATVPVYAQDVQVDFHPLYLAHGVDPTSGTERDVNSPDTILSGRCGGAQGDGGVWLCAQTNATAGCQADEFIVKPDDPNNPGSPPSLRFDFFPPPVVPEKFAAVIADRGVQLRWDGQPSDINGYRVLCERADGQPAPGQAFDPPDPLAEADGKHYFNAHNLCGDRPFLTYKSAEQPAGDGTCGDGHRDDGEQCDDGEDNSDAGLCREDCSLAVSPELHALDWAYLCSDHLDWTQRSVNIYGLENGVDYNFVLVAHDGSGNPRAVPIVARAAPDGAFDPLPGSPPAPGCDCRSQADAPWGLALLLGLGLRRRRRAR